MQLRCFLGEHEVHPCVHPEKYEMIPYLVRRDEPYVRP